MKPFLSACAITPTRTFQITIATFERRDLGARQHLDIGLRIDALDEIVRHARLEALPASDQPHFSHVGCEIDGGRKQSRFQMHKKLPRAPVGRIFRLGLLLGRNSQLRRSNVLDTTKVLPPTVAPPTRPLSILQSIRAARRNVLEIIPQLAYRQPMLSGRMGSRWHMVQNPVALRRVLLDNVENYPK